MRLVITYKATLLHLSCATFSRCVHSEFIASRCTSENTKDHSQIQRVAIEMSSFTFIKK
jgi:hypothetical protein